MQNLCQRLLELLNEPESGPVFQAFVGDLISSPTIRRSHEHFTDRMFTELGVTVHSTNDQIMAVSFHLSEHADAKPYTDTLPIGLVAQDHRAEIRARLGPPLTSHRDDNVGSRTESYQTETLRLAFSYRSDVLVELRVMPRNFCNPWQPWQNAT